MKNFVKIFFFFMLMGLSACQSSNALESVLSTQEPFQREVSAPEIPTSLPNQSLPAATENSTTEIPNDLSSQAVPTVTEIIPQKIQQHDLLIPVGNTIYQGAWLPVKGNNLPADVKSFQDDVNHKLDSVIYYVSWNEQDWKWCQTQLEIAGSLDLTVQVVWEPWLKDKSNPLQSIVDGEQDEHIDYFARGAAKYGKPFFLRFAHEMNGNWYPWSGENTGKNPDLYIQAWKHVWERFKQAGAENVIWVWSPNALSVPAASWNDISAYYPGQEYVDWVGVDFYGLKWSNDPPETMIDPIYLLYGKNHPIMIAETAAADPKNVAQDVTMSKPAWIKRLFDVLPFYPELKAIYWFNEIKEADWRVQSEPSPDSLDAYRQGWEKVQ